MPILILIFILVPLAELYLIVKIGGAIGVPLTLAILLVDALIGSLLLRHQGRAAWRRFNKALEERRFPGREVADGVAVTIGGTLLLTPGFITDVFGLILLIPPTRAIVRKVAWSLIGWRYKVVGGAAGWGYERMRRPGPGQDSPGAAGSGSGPGPGAAYDFDGTAQEMPSNGSVSAASEGRGNGGDSERPALPPT